MQGKGSFDDLLHDMQKNREAKRNANQSICHNLNPNPEVSMKDNQSVANNHSVPIADVNMVDTKPEVIKCKITIDSGAAVSVLPYESMKDLFPLLPKQEGVRFCAADGTELKNYGKMNVAFRALRLRAGKGLIA